MHTLLYITRCSSFLQEGISWKTCNRPVHSAMPTQVRQRHIYKNAKSVQNLMFNANDIKI